MVWTARLSPKGYGRAWDGKREDWAHRVAYRCAHGEIPNGLHIDHLCRNPACINPDHLEAVTPAENTRRSTSPEVTRARFKSQTHCKRGHPLFGSNLMARPGARHCRACRNIAVAKYRAANPEKHRERADRVNEKRRQATAKRAADRRGHA